MYKSDYRQFFLLLSCVHESGVYICSDSLKVQPHINNAAVTRMYLYQPSCMCVCWSQKSTAFNRIQPTNISLMLVKVTHSECWEKLYSRSHFLLKREP